MTRMFSLAIVASVVAASGAIASPVRNTHAGAYQATYQQNGPGYQSNFGGAPNRSRVQVYVLGQGLQWKTIETPKTND